MTQVVDQSQFTQAMREHFLSGYYARHDTLEVLLESERFAAAAQITSDIATAARRAGLARVENAARMTGEFLTTELSLPTPDRFAMRRVLNAFLDVSMQVCNPTERLHAC